VLIFLDLETTGLEANDTICSIAILDAKNQKYYYELINEGKKIPPQASSIHHITNEMLKDKPKFKESKIYKFLHDNNHVENTIVAHNVQFSIQKLALAGLIWKGGVIDTLRVTKHLIPECELFSLQVLRYELKLYKQEREEKEYFGIKNALYAHHALSDAIVTKLLFTYLLELSSEESMEELSFKNVLIDKFTFGKYKGKYIEEISMKDRAYLEWMLHATDIDEDIKYSINHYLRG